MAHSLDLLRHEDIPQADALRALAGWNQTAEDWADLLALAPDGCFAARAGSRLVGTATVTPYGAELAWIGMVLVHPEHRRRGVAAALLERCLSWLAKRGTRVIALDASEAGEALYQKRGFERVASLRRWVRERPPPSAPGAAAGVALTAADWPDVGELDRQACGVDRMPLLRAFAARARAVRLRRDGAGLEAFGYLRAGAFADAIAPVAARSPAAVQRLVDDLLAQAAERPVVWDVPDENEGAVSRARALGFAPVRSFTRMTLGGRLGGDAHRQWAILDPATG